MDLRGESENKAAADEKKEGSCWRSAKIGEKSLRGSHGIV